MTHLQALAALAAAEAQVKWWHEFANERIREKEAAEAENKRLTEALREVFLEAGFLVGTLAHAQASRRAIRALADAALKDAPRPPDPDEGAWLRGTIDTRTPDSTGLRPTPDDPARADNPNPKEVVPSAPKADVSTVGDGSSSPQTVSIRGPATPGAAGEVVPAAPATCSLCGLPNDQHTGYFMPPRAAPLSEARPEAEVRCDPGCPTPGMGLGCAPREASKELLSEETSQPGTPVDPARAALEDAEIALCAHGQAMVPTDVVFSWLQVIRRALAAAPEGKRPQHPPEQPGTPSDGARVTLLEHRLRDAKLHECMRCGEQFACPASECGAKYAVLPPLDLAVHRCAAAPAGERSPDKQSEEKK